MQLRYLAFIFLFLSKTLFAVEPFEEAEKRAIRENKPLMIFFLGSGWCHWCEEMKKKVLSKRDFARNVERHFIVIEVDFPKGAGRKKNENTYRHRFGVNRYPTLVIYDPKTEKVFKESGFLDMRPKDYAERLKEKFFDTKKNSATVGAGLGWLFKQKSAEETIPCRIDEEEEEAEEIVELDLNPGYVWLPPEAKIEAKVRNPTIGSGAGVPPRY